ncbi:AAA family ATPase [Okeania sp. KiyG1]|uniref:AAA family ATPase n=1 Tax=Okeania sp. KiyG1 TaxID=2720165 RepID=UPI001F2F21B3|nr:AAA family ATPase [Okeania sp. KiyG1]
MAVWGGPGMGKTSFLNLLTSEQIWQSQNIDRSEAIIIYLNCLEIKPFIPANFWRKIIYSIGEKTKDDSIVQLIKKSLQKPKSTKEHLRYILRKIGEQKKFLVLLLDDYDATLNSHSRYTETDVEVFLSECRNLAYHSEERKYLSMIVTSLRRLNEKGPNLTPNGSPWYNHFGFQRLKPLNDKEIGMLLSGMQMTREIRDGIEEIAGGNPALLQNTGSILHNKRRSGETLNAEIFAKEFVEATEHFFQDTWQLANELEQALLMLIALYQLKGRVQKTRYDLSDISVIFSQKERELMDLEERCVIKQTVEQEKTNYSFTSTIMEWWVIKEIENTNTEILKQREMVFANFMSRKQVDKVKDVINYLSEHKEAIKSIAKWVGKLAPYLA